MVKINAIKFAYICAAVLKLISEKKKKIAVEILLCSTETKSKKGRYNLKGKNDLFILFQNILYHQSDPCLYFDQ